MKNTTKLENSANSFYRNYLLVGTLLQLDSFCNCIQLNVVFCWNRLPVSKNDNKIAITNSHEEWKLKRQTE